MTLHDRRRTDTFPAHAYTLPVVREVAIRAGGAAAGTPISTPEPPAYPGSAAW
jgi:hypothetical protein